MPFIIISLPAINRMMSSAVVSMLEVSNSMDSNLLIAVGTVAFTAITTTVSVLSFKNRTKSQTAEEIMKAVDERIEVVILRMKDTLQLGSMSNDIKRAIDLACNTEKMFRETEKSMDARLDSIDKTMNGFDHRIRRNSQQVSMVMKEVLSWRRVDAGPHPLHDDDADDDKDI